MKPDPFPSTVRSLITERIDSVGQLEIVLLLSANPARVWTSGEVALELRTSPPWAEEQLEIMQRRGLVAKSGGGAGAPAHFRYGAHGELDGAVKDLSGAYSSYPVAVVTLIYTKPTRSMTTFADAFRLRREPPASASPEAEGSRGVQAPQPPGRPENPDTPVPDGGLQHG